MMDLPPPHNSTTTHHLYGICRMAGCAGMSTMGHCQPLPTQFCAPLHRHALQAFTHDFL
jgi:hypothetical protein